MTDNTQELDVNKLEQIIADHNKEMRADMASEITGGTRSKAITDVITVKAILGWHNKQIAKARLAEWEQFGGFFTEADKRAVSLNFFELYRLHGQRLIEELGSYE